jgi:chromosome segregation ATPase
MYLSTTCSKLKEAIDSLEAEKLSLSYSLQNSMDEIEAYKEQVAQLQDKIRDLHAAAEQDQFVPNSTVIKSSSSSTRTDLLQRDSTEDESHPSHVNVLPSPDLEEENSRTLVEKLTLAEQQREHWMLEYQLLKMKYSKIFMVPVIQ